MTQQQTRGILPCEAQEELIGNRTHPKTHLAILSIQKSIWRGRGTGGAGACGWQAESCSKLGTLSRRCSRGRGQSAPGPAIQLQHLNTWARTSNEAGGVKNHLDDSKNYLDHTKNPLDSVALTVTLKQPWIKYHMQATEQS